MYGNNNAIVINTPQCTFAGVELASILLLTLFNAYVFLDVHTRVNVSTLMWSAIRPETADYVHASRTFTLLGDGASQTTPSVHSA